MRMRGAVPATAAAPSPGVLPAGCLQLTKRDTSQGVSTGSVTSDRTSSTSRGRSSTNSVLTAADAIRLGA